jgi:hypothetical protein
MQVDFFDELGIEKIECNESGECKSQKARGTQNDTATTQQLEADRLMLRRVLRAISQLIGSRWMQC